jgi:metallo-beta-lactamase family protein
VLFSGDIGRGDHLLLDDAPPRPNAATIVCESTYGDRRHPAVDAVDELQAALSPVLERGGVALIPAFAVGRAQELLAALEILYAEDRLERVPVYLDSPMAAKTLALTKEEEVELSEVGRERLARAIKHTKICAFREQSMKLNDLRGPAIIIAGSGMLTGGRILHHLAERAGRQEDALILTGFQARGTRGRRIADGEETIKIFGQPVSLKLEVRSLTAFSAHADQEGLLNWLAQGDAPQRVILNHGERTAASAFVQAVRAKFRSAFPVVAAQYGARYDLVPDVETV